MSSIKITVSEEEKAAIEAEAHAAGMSTSKYVRQCLENRHQNKGLDLSDSVTFPFNKEDLKTNGTNMYIRIPKDLNASIRRTAKQHGMSISDYIVSILAAKGTPVEINVDLPSKQMYSAELSNLLNEVLSLLDTALQTGVMYPSEMNVVVNDLKTAAMEFTKAADQADRDFTKQIDNLREEVLLKSSGTSDQIP